MRKAISTIFFACMLTTAFAQSDYRDAMKAAALQTNTLLKETAAAKAAAHKPNVFSPRSINEKGELVLVSSKDWCAGFFPGNLWFLYEYTGDAKWKEAAVPFTSVMEGERSNAGTHDMGFKVYNSVGNAYRLTHDAHYKDVVLEAAKTLSKRFNPTVGSIKSWDGRNEWKFPVIIDNMMNLELLFEATRISGDSSFYKIAVTHANTTIKNHFRANNSSYHVIDYDPQTGEVLHKQTHQGYADSSSWARGQAWGLYGYTMCFRETHDAKYLKQAENIAAFIFDNPNMPADLVPYWDYDAPNLSNQPKDVSAAAITASALYELSTYSKNGRKYRVLADRIVSNLYQKYRPQEGDARGFLLLHSTGHLPAKGEIDVTIIYADYYYLEALLRQKRLADKGPVINVSGKLKR